jgi:hypothetical protein
MDPLFSEYKTIIGSFHLTPREIIMAALKEKGKGLLLSEMGQISVISWILPAAEDTRKSNRKNNFHQNYGPTLEILEKPVIAP